MHIWVDADACPAVIKDILYRAAERKKLAPGDLVVTADIPLAADVIAKGAHALNPRGEFYSTENIQERLALRNYLDELRGTGERTGGPAALESSRNSARLKTLTPRYS